VILISTRRGFGADAAKSNHQRCKRDIKEEELNGHKRTAIASLSLTLILALQAAGQGQAQDSKTAYPEMAPLDQYLMDRNAEIALARSAAPGSISRDAKVLVLTRHGYETAVEGKNGFVCVVGRSWMLPFENQEFWNPRVRLPLCANPPGARFHVALAFKTAELAVAGLSKNQISDRLKAAYDNKELPLPANGSMSYMMSKQQYFGDKIGNAGDSHLMFWFPEGEHMEWGADAPDSPVDVHQYSPQPISEFSISVSKWSDGTPVGSK
jgi:hypothetical protein